MAMWKHIAIFYGEIYIVFQINNQNEKNIKIGNQFPYKYVLYMSRLY